MVSPIELHHFRDFKTSKIHLYLATIVFVLDIFLLNWIDFWNYWFL